MANPRSPTPAPWVYTLAWIVVILLWGSVNAALMWGAITVDTPTKQFVVTSLWNVVFILFGVKLAGDRRGGQNAGR